MAQGETAKSYPAPSQLWCVTGSGARNRRLVDPWSGAHLLSGVALGWIMAPFWALLLLILWEPLELFVLSPLSWKFFGREFGHETLGNSFSDILFDAAGVAIGAFLVRQWLTPPFVLLG